MPRAAWTSTGQCAPRDALCSLAHWRVQLYQIWQMALEGRAVYPQHIWDKGKTQNFQAAPEFSTVLSNTKSLLIHKRHQIYFHSEWQVGINAPTESLEFPALSLLSLKTWRCVSASCQGSSSSAWACPGSLHSRVHRARQITQVPRQQWGATKPVLFPSLMQMKRFYSSESFDHRDQKSWTTLTLCCPGLLLSISTDGKCFQAGETFKVIAFLLSRWPETERTPVDGQTELLQCTSTPWTTGFTSQRALPTATTTSPGPQLTALGSGGVRGTVIPKTDTLVLLLAKVSLLCCYMQRFLDGIHLLTSTDFSTVSLVLRAPLDEDYGPKNPTPNHS